MADILEILNIIQQAQYGREVRQAIVDGISQCYEDGKAGVNDLEARRLIETAIAVNEQQEGLIDALTGRVEELENGSGSDTPAADGKVTTEIPAYIIDYGYKEVEIGANSTYAKNVTFNKEFDEPPIVFALTTWKTNYNNYYSQVVVAPINDTITTTGFRLGCGNKYSQKVYPMVLWVAIQPKTITVETEVIVPSYEDLTQEQIDQLVGLLE